MNEPLAGRAEQEAKGSEPVRVRHRRYRPPQETMDAVAGGYFWGGLLGVLLDLITLRRVRRKIRESHQRRARRGRDGA